MKQCFGYIRVSTVKQGDGASLEAQQAAIEQFAARNDITISKWFEEKQTAAKRGRPVFGAMLRALRAHKADGVVMHKIDRSARNFADWAKIGDLADEGIDVHFATESLDFRSRGGRLSADIQAVIAADYIRNLRDETLKGMYGRLNQGLYPWAAPTGYLDNGGGKPKTPDPVTGPLIRELFELYGSGQHSLHSLVKEMARRGLRNAQGKPLAKSGIEKVLNNPFYCGIIRIKKTGEVFDGVHVPLISVALFERVQDVKAGKSGKKVTRHNHLFRGLFRCGNCDAAMTPERQKGYVYYRCQNTACPTKCVREEHLDAAVLRVLSFKKLTEAQIAWALEEVNAWAQTGEETGKAEEFVARIALVTGRLDALTDALVDRLVDNETFVARRESLVLERTQYEDELRRIRQRPDYLAKVQTFLERIKNLADNYRFGDPATKREIVQIAVSNRHVTGKNVEPVRSDWLHQTDCALTVYSGDPACPTSRNVRGMQDVHVEKLIALSESKEARWLAKIDGDTENENDEVDMAA